MFRKVRNQVLSSIVVVAMVLSLVPAIQPVKTNAATKLDVHVSVNGAGDAAFSFASEEGVSYEVYKAQSRFAEYSKVATINSAPYLTNDYY